jgi:shikimate kinase
MAKIITTSKSIVLVGMMGVGKTTVGKKLAAALNIPFYDSDHEIESEIGHSISWIFENIGEVEFRKMEARTISKFLNDMPPHILATGGGAFVNEETRKLIKEKSFSIWLKADVSTILSRVSKKANRPLLDVGDKKEMILKLMEQREKIYSEADISIATDRGTAKEILAEIIRHCC